MELIFLGLVLLVLGLLMYANAPAYWATTSAEDAARWRAMAKGRLSMPYDPDELDTPAVASRLRQAVLWVKGLVR